MCHDVCVHFLRHRSSLTVLQFQRHWQLKAGVYVGSEIGSGDLFKSAVTKPGQEEWDDGDGVGAKKEPKNLVEYAENYHEEISRLEADKGFQNPAGISLFKMLWAPAFPNTSLLTLIFRPAPRMDANNSLRNTPSLLCLFTPT